jgi:zinc protease
MLDEGTTSRTALEIAADSERLGAKLSAFARLETNNVRLSALKSNLGPSLALMTDVIRNPAFTQPDIDRVRRIWLAGIEQEQAEPVGLALRLLPPAIYGAGSAYGSPLTGSGSPDSTAALTREDLLRFHRERIRPDNATFFVVGDLTLADATTALETVLRGWSAPAEPIPAIAPVSAPERAAPRLILVDRPGSPQSLILAGRATTPAAAPTALAQEVMNDAFGGLFSARVNMNLREAKGWSYGASTFFLNGKGPRPWLIYAPVQADKTSDSLVELRREVSELVRARPITADEFERARLQSIRALPGSFETAANVLDALAGAWASGRPLDWTATLATRYRAMSLSDAQAAASEIVRADDLVWVVVGDRAALEKDLRGLDLAPIEIWDVNGRPVR